MCVIARRVRRVASSVLFLVVSPVGEPRGLRFCSAEGYGPDDDEDVEEDEGNCCSSVISHVILLGTSNHWDCVNSLRISVRTELIRLIVLAFTLAPSCAPPPPPKEGSFCAALPQPTVFVLC